jgi:hypothetical protein
MYLLLLDMCEVLDVIDIDYCITGTLRARAPAIAPTTHTVGMQEYGMNV